MAYKNCTLCQSLLVEQLYTTAHYTVVASAIANLAGFLLQTKALLFLPQLIEDILPVLGCLWGLQDFWICHLESSPALLYNILLPINCYIGNSTTKNHSRSMTDNRDLTETFHQKISSHHKVIASVSRISNPHEYAQSVTKYSVLPLPV